MKIKIICFLAIIFLVSCSSYPGGFGDPTIAGRIATVKVTVVSSAPNYYLPWKMDNPASTSGSGAIISGSRIITNAHVVADAVYIEVQKENDPVKYQAKVLFSAHDCDLALLTVDDPEFFKGTKALPFIKDIPRLNSKVSTYGFPTGGNRISITDGVVSRIQMFTYIHSSKYNLLVAQTDAAINPGNSGGPVIMNNRIAGIAFQNITDSQNLGYMIPVPVISRFLEDVKDGRYDGISRLGISWANLENKDFREWLGMTSVMTGIYVLDVEPGSPADGFLIPGDVILSMDKIDLGNDGSIPLNAGRIEFSYLVYSKQIGSTINLQVFRNNDLLGFSIPMKPVKERIVWYNEYDKQPDYYIFGGIVFQELSKGYLQSWKEWWKEADRLLLYYYAYNRIDKIHTDREEFVIINRILPDPVNTYISQISSKVVDTINDKKITCMEDVIEAFNNPVAGFHVIVVDGYSKPLIIKASDMGVVNKRILENYGIKNNLYIANQNK